MITFQVWTEVAKSFLSERHKDKKEVLFQPGKPTDLYR